MATVTAAFRLKPARCPECNAWPTGLVERVLVVANIHREGRGFDYDGESEVIWDTQESIINEPGKVRAQCPSYHEFDAEMIEC